jgi:CO dehydrogenase/acetyl-CoA synthase delta subunit
MEMEVDNLKMDMSGVELSVANAHRQVQRVEDKVVATLAKKVSDMYQEFFTSGGAMESRFDGMLEEHHDRLNAVELGNERAAEKCDSVREVLTLGAEGVLPGRHIVSLVRVFKQFTHLIPSGQMLSSFKTYSPL